MNTFTARDFERGWMIPESCVAAKHIREAISILDAIKAGELLSALPANDADRHRHQTAVNLLDMLERSLHGALGDAPSAAHPCHAAQERNLEL